MQTVGLTILAVAGLAIQASAGTIVPGHSLGTVSLDEHSNHLKSLGSPIPGNEGDAAMGHFWTNYGLPGKKHVLSVYTVRVGDGTIETVEQIRTNSPTFHTANGGRVGVSLARIRHLFPHGQIVSEKMGDKPIDIFDDKVDGIAFEFPGHASSKSQCTAIIVHEKGEAVTDVYFPYYDVESSSGG